MMRFDKLTPHQRTKLEDVRNASCVLLLAPAGGGKTFIAIQRILEVLRINAGARVLFVSKNTALALFVCKWLIIASGWKAQFVTDRIDVLVAPFDSGLRHVKVEDAGTRQRLVLINAAEGEIRLLPILPRGAAPWRSSTKPTTSSTKPKCVASSPLSTQLMTQRG
jgi:hypothetical protein